MNKIRFCVVGVFYFDRTWAHFWKTLSPHNVALIITVKTATQNI